MKDVDLVDTLNEDAEEGEEFSAGGDVSVRKPRLNRFARKRRHKYELKKKHARDTGRHSVRYDEERERYWNNQFCGSKWHNPQNGGYIYWQRTYLSGCRRYAKFCTNRRIRSRYRMQIRLLDPEDIVAPRGSDYEKEFDFSGTLY